MLVAILILSALIVVLGLILFSVIARSYELHRMMKQQDRMIRRLHEAFLEVFDRVQNFSDELKLTVEPLSMYQGDVTIRDLISHTRFLVKFIKESVEPFALNLEVEIDGRDARKSTGEPRKRGNRNSRNERKRQKKGASS